MIEHRPDTPDARPPDEASTRDANWVPWTTQQTFRGVLFTLIPWIIFSLLLSSASGGSTEPSQPLTMAQDLTGGIIALIFAALIEGAFLIGPYYYARLALIQADMASNVRAIFQTLGLRRFHHVWRVLLLILGLLVLIFAFNVLYSSLIQALHLDLKTNDQVLLEESKTSPLSVYGILIGSILAAPFCEELFFRGFILPGLLRELSPTWALLISSALFAVAHADPGSFLPLFAIGLALGFIRLRTGSTWASISLHVLNNLLASVIIVLAAHGISLPF